MILFYDFHLFFLISFISFGVTRPWGWGGVEFGAATQDLTSDMFEGYRVGAGTMPIKIQQVTQHQSRSSWCHFLAYRGEMGQHLQASRGHLEASGGHLEASGVIWRLVEASGTPQEASGSRLDTFESHLGAI